MNKRQRELHLSDEEAQRELRKRSRRGFLIGGLAAVGAIGGYEWLGRAPQENDQPWPLRRVLQANGALSHGYLSDGHLAPTYSPRDITPLKSNGDIGLKEEMDPEQVESVGLGGLRRTQLDAAAARYSGIATSGDDHPVLLH